MTTPDVTSYGDTDAYGRVPVMVDPTRDVVLVTSGDTVYTLTDGMRPDPTADLPSVVRAVLAARLRAWADHIDAGRIAP